MKNQLLLIPLVVILSINSIISQQNHIEVEGDTKIRGNIDINHTDDSTSVYIGRNSNPNTGLFRYFNTFVGTDVGFLNVKGGSNSFFGASSGFNGTTGDNNSFFGTKVGFNNTIGYNNSFFGAHSGFGNTTGNSNSFFGEESGVGNTTGTRNTFIGFRSGNRAPPDSLDRAIAIGHNSKVQCSNCMVLGGTGPDTVRVGIGTSIPTAMLDVRGNAIKALVTDGDTVALKLFEGAGFGFEFQYDGNADKLHLWSRKFSANEGIRMTWLKNGNVGIDATNPEYKLQVGSMGDGTEARANAWTTFSDRRWKRDLELIKNPLKIIQQISGYYYYWKEGLDQRRQTGVIAQEIEKIMPELVSTDDHGIKSVEYGKISALLIEAIKVQQESILLFESQLLNQQDEIDKLTNQVSEIDNLKEEIAEFRKLLRSKVKNVSEE